MKTGGTRDQVDFSFMVSRRCDLRCTFCMYNSGPEVADWIDMEKLRSFVATIAADKIHAWGFYGGEPWLFRGAIEEIVSWLPPKPVFVITNGTWVKNERVEFESFIERINGTAFVSRTPQHVENQDAAQICIAIENPRIQLKQPDTTFLPMGRLGYLPSQCTQKCSWDAGPIRLAATPDNEVILQTCDGKYPVVGNLSEAFDVVENRARFHNPCPGRVYKGA